MPALADDIVHLKREVIVTPAFTAAQALKNATRTIPVVFISNDPIGAAAFELPMVIEWQCNGKVKNF
jgi:ABC-type uncharacterized transport system substrate-binding protein